MAVRARWEKMNAAILASGSRNLVGLQVIYKTVYFGNGGETDSTEFIEAIIDLFFAAHFLSPQYGNISVKADATDIMDKTEFRIIHLNVSGFFPQLQYHRSNLGPTGCADGMAL